MVKTASRKRPRPGRTGARSRAPDAGFAILANAALARGEPDAVADQTLQAVLAAAVRVYAAKVERHGNVAPFAQGAVTATDAIVAACGMIRAADLNPFDVAMWFHRTPAR